MTSQSLRNDAEPWRTCAEEVRMLASEEKDMPTKDALLRVADDYERLAHCPGPALVAVERRDLAVEPFPIEFAGKLHQLVLHVDDLIEPGPKRSLASVVSCFFGRIIPSDATTESLFVPEGNPKNEIARFKTLRSQILAISNPPAA